MKTLSSRWSVVVLIGIVVVLSYFIYSRFVNNPASNVASLLPPSTFSKPITITKGGTYIGNWESKDANVAAVTIKTNDPVIITNSNIRSKGHLIDATQSNALNLQVINTKGFGMNPDVSMRLPGRFLITSGVAYLGIKNNYMENTRGMQIVGPRVGNGSISIVNNIAKNIDGRVSGGPGKWSTQDIDYVKDHANNGKGMDVGSLYGQFVQVYLVSGMSIDISWNQIISNPYESRTEDNINILESMGRSSSPIHIHDNYIQGAYSADPLKSLDATKNINKVTYDGGGIIVDSHSGNVLIDNNSVVGTSNYGISSPGSTNVTISNNRIISSSLLPNGKAIFYYPQGGNVGLVGYGPNNNVVFSNNVVGWTRANGTRYDIWPNTGTFKNNHAYVPLVGKPDGKITLADEAAELKSWQQKVKVNNIILGPTQ